MQKIKDVFFKILKWVWRLAIHAGLLWASLALGYNSYKQYMSMSVHDPLPRAIKNMIISKFPQAVILFVILYLLFSQRKKGSLFFLSVWRYIAILSIYTIVLNLSFYSIGRHILIPFNLAILYFVILLNLLGGINKYLLIDNSDDLMRLEEWLPPIVYRFSNNNLPKIQALFKEKPFALSIIIFMVLLYSGSFLLLLRAENIVEQMANFAYFSLIIGAGRELYLYYKR